MGRAYPIALAHLITVLIGLGSVPSLSQSPLVIVAPEGEIKGIQTTAKLAMERALFANDIDSIRYWRDCWTRAANEGPERKTRLLDRYERTLVNFVLGAYSDLDRDIELEDHYLIGRRNHAGKYSKHVPGQFWSTGPSLTAGIRDLWRVRSGDVLNRIHTEVADTVEREFLTLYWMSMLNHVSGFTTDSVFSQALINQRANALLPTLGESLRAQVLRTYIRRQYKLAKWAMGFSFSTGMNVLFGGLDRQFKDARNFSVTADIEIHDWKVQFSILGLTGSLRNDLRTDHGLWTGESRVSGNSFGGSLGRLVWRGPVVNIFPAVGIYSSQLVYRESEDDEAWSRPFALPTAELSADLKLNCLKKSNREDFNAATLQQKGMNYWMVRLRLGYAPLGYGPVIAPQGSIFFASLGFGAFTRPPRLDRD